MTITDTSKSLRELSIDAVSARPELLGAIPEGVTFSPYVCNRLLEKCLDSIRDTHDFAITDPTEFGAEHDEYNAENDVRLVQRRLFRPFARSRSAITRLDLTDLPVSQELAYYLCEQHASSLSSLVVDSSWAPVNADLNSIFSDQSADDDADVAMASRAIFSVIKQMTHLKRLAFCNQRPEHVTFLLGRLEGGDGDGAAESCLFPVKNLQFFVFSEFVNVLQSRRNVPKRCLTHLLSDVSSLNHLELCDTNLDWDEVQRNRVFEQLADTLNVLILAGTIIANDQLDTVLQMIGQCRQLRHLDISQISQFNAESRTSIYEYVVYEPDPTEKVKKLVDRLIYLRSLDISGTNLAGKPKMSQAYRAAFRAMEEPKQEAKNDAFPAFSNRHFDYLGLFHCAHEADARPVIPADSVAGSQNFDQLLCAIERFAKRPRFVSEALTEMFNIVRAVSQEQRQSDEIISQNAERLRVSTLRNRLLEVTLAVMTSFRRDQDIITSGSAVLFYLLRIGRRSEEDFSFYPRREICRVLIRALCFEMRETPYNAEHMVRNILLCLCYMDTPADIMRYYKPLADVLIQKMLPYNRDYMHLVVFVYNKVVCSVDYGTKKMVGVEMGGIRRVLFLIQQFMADEDRVQDVLSNAWSSLWNITDETDCNCQEFCDNGGLDLFHDVYQRYAATATAMAAGDGDDDNDNEEPSVAVLVRNMMGLMGNIAEVAALRPRLMEDRSVKLFSTLLASNIDGIEVSYNAAGVLANMVADGPEAWTCKSLSRDFIQLNIIKAASQRWELSRLRCINYRSFRPIFTLIVNPSRGSPGAQYWALWALANLTSVYSRYSPMVRENGGDKILMDLLKFIDEVDEAERTNSDKYMDVRCVQTPLHRRQMRVKYALIFSNLRAYDDMRLRRTPLPGLALDWSYLGGPIGLDVDELQRQSDAPPEPLPLNEDGSDETEERGANQAGQQRAKFVQNLIRRLERMNEASRYDADQEDADAAMSVVENTDEDASKSLAENAVEYVVVENFKETAGEGAGNARIEDVPDEAAEDTTENTDDQNAMDTG